RYIYVVTELQKYTQFWNVNYHGFIDCLSSIECILRLIDGANVTVFVRDTPAKGTRQKPSLSSRLYSMDQTCSWVCSRYHTMT
uniref:Uncharacterized protein n=1 Tax=Aegilops tauschii subsp. strangulata TaxID=200361 RepID=A0A453I6H4_AEGTS